MGLTLVQFKSGKGSITVMHIYSTMIREIQRKKRISMYCNSLVPRPLPPGKGPGAHRLRMCKITSKISVKVSVHYNLPRGTLTSSSNKKLGKSLSCPLPANRPNERFAFA